MILIDSLSAMHTRFDAAQRLVVPCDQLQDVLRDSTFERTIVQINLEPDIVQFGTGREL